MLPDVHSRHCWDFSKLSTEDILFLIGKNEHDLKKKQKTISVLAWEVSYLCLSLAPYSLGPAPCEDTPWSSRTDI